MWYQKLEVCDLQINNAELRNYLSEQNILFQKGSR